MHLAWLTRWRQKRILATKRTNKDKLNTTMPSIARKQSHGTKLIASALRMKLVVSASRMKQLNRCVTKKKKGTETIGIMKENMLLPCAILSLNFEKSLVTGSSIPLKPMLFLQRKNLDIYPILPSSKNSSRSCWNLPPYRCMDIT